MKKKIFIIIIIFIVFCVSFVSANDLINNIFKESILSSSNLEIEQNSNFDLTLDLSKINYEKFKIVLTSNINIGIPEIENPEKSNIETDIDTSNNLFTMNIIKSDLNVESLSLSYTLPESISVGNSVQFILKVYPELEDNSSEEIVIEDSITFSVVEKTNSEKTKNSEIDDNKDFNMPDNTENNNNNNNSYINKDFNDDQSKSNNKMQLSNNSINNVSSVVGSVSSNLKSETTISTNNSKENEDTTYNGSSNNYLASLSIDGYSFTKDFNKTNSTYFVTVDSNVTSININAIAEEYTSTINIYGNTNLTTGTNKVLITVTSEDGSTRTYRIYVTK